MINKSFYSNYTVLRYLFIFSCFIPLLIFRDFTPNNELKYLSIADEAIRDGHFFAFWNHGAVYADKPPLYLWIIMLGKWLFGFHSMFFIGLFSIIPALITLYIMDKWVAPFLPVNLRQSGQLMLITSGLFAGSAIVLRMDMLMCMFIVLALYTFYKLYAGQGQRSDRILLPVYIFLAVFSKGPVGVLIPLLSIASFLLVKREIRSFGRYMGWRQFSILIGLCALWFGTVYAEGGSIYLNNLLFNQTINRAVDAFHHKQPFWYYFKTIWYSLAPWALLYITVIIIGIKKKIIQTDVEKLFLTVIATTFIALSLFSGKLDIYMLPIFPFIAYMAFLLSPKINQRCIYLAIAIPAILLMLTFPAIFIAANYIEFPISGYPSLWIATFILSATATLGLVFLFKKQWLRSANVISIGILTTLLIGSFAIPKLNPYIGFGDLAQKAQEIAYGKKINNYYFYQFRSGKNIDSYLNKEINDITIKELLQAMKKRSFILFVRNTDIEPGGGLYEVARNKERYSIGDYSIIVFYIN